ncbi:RDD family protein [Nonomuraea sp. NPDC059194]|uniref:RDD family protein n=1 Tax=Nonomuraea sp. NPDC059194 TaxID=3346764 RepID=UPI00368D5AB2
MVAPPPGVRAVPADWWERLVARSIEGLVVGVFYYILFIAAWALWRTVGLLAVYGDWLPGFSAWLVVGLAYAGYDCLAHYRRRRTFGKAIMKIRLAPAPGRRLSLADLSKRALLYPGPLVLVEIPVVNLVVGILVFAVGLSILIDKPLQRGLHDRWAGSLMIKDPR